MADLFSDTNGVLINRYNIKDASELSQKEANISLVKLAQLNLKGGIPGGKFDKDHFQQIHKQLFSRIYPWAGETRADRQFQGHKPTYATGSKEIMVFAPYSDIDKNLKAISQQLEKENYLKGLPIEKFIDRAAVYLDQFNYTHTFREGNGRSLQAAFTQLASQAGYSLDFNKLKSKDDYNKGRDLGMVRIHGAPDNEKNLEAIKNVLRTITSPIQTKEAEQIRSTPVPPSPPKSQDLLRMEVKRDFDVTSLRLTEVYTALRGMEPVDAFLKRFHEVRFDEKSIVKHKDAYSKFIKAVVNHPMISPGSQDFNDAKRFEQSILQLEKLAKGQRIDDSLKQKPRAPRLR